MTKANEDDLMPVGELAAMVFNSKFDTMKEKLNDADLALYLGQKCQSEAVTAPLEITPTLLYDALRGVEFKPLLRPLSDLTEYEARYLHAIVFGREFAGLTSCIEWMFQSFQPAEIDRIGCLMGHYPAWRYLLSIGIDLFGWIESGLAIDKTKIEQS